MSNPINGCIMLKKFIPLCLLLLFSLNTIKAQRLNENKNYSLYSYVFKLDSSQMRKAFSGVKIDSSMFLTHLVDSFHHDSVYHSEKLGYGFYFFVYLTIVFFVLLVVLLHKKLKI